MINGPRSGMMNDELSACGRGENRPKQLRFFIFTFELLPVKRTVK